MKPALLSFDEALAAILSKAAPLPGSEQVATYDACHRVLSADLRSAINVPPMDNSQMDGYAVRRSDLAAGHPLRVSQRIAAGQVGVPLESGTVARVFTGAMVPAGADAIVMQEQALADGDGVRFSVTPELGEWIRRTGEDIRAGAVILPAGTRLTPQSIGLAASVGLARLPVSPQARVACFFTGDELAMPGEVLKPGAIYNSNRFVLVSLLRRLGCEVTDLGIVPDSLARTREALVRAAADHDLIITSGGMSVGEEDHVKPAVEAEGALDLWNIAMKPGKPLAYGTVRRPGADGSAHFIGLPGNPVSAFVTFVLFARPFIQRLQGCAQVAPARLSLRADFDWPKPDRRREFLRVRFNATGGLDLYPNQGSAVLTSTVWADGLVDNPAGRSIERGDRVNFLPMSGLLD